MPFQITAKAEGTDKHEYDINTLLFHGGILYSAADDGKIKAWSADLKFLCEVQAHPCSVFCITASPDVLYSCSNDGTIKSWSLKDLKPLKTLHQGESEMWRVVFSDGVLYSGDDQGVIRTFKNDKPVAIINILEPVKDMAVKDMILFTVRNLDVVVTEIRPGTEGDKGVYGTRTTLMGRAPLCLAGDKLCFSSRGGKDIFLHENSHELRYKELSEASNAHELIINTLCGSQIKDDTFVYSGGWDKVVKEWKIHKDKLEARNTCKVDMCINVLTTGDKGQIYAAGGDGNIIRIE